MATPRRSARLRAVSDTPDRLQDTAAATGGADIESQMASGAEVETPKKKNEKRKRSKKNTPKPKLNSVEEQEEPGESGEYQREASKQLTTELANSSPVRPATMSPTKHTPLQTPRTEKKHLPGLEEMHPSKAHQSTTKQPDSGLRLGFTDIPNKASNKNQFLQETPSKSRTSVRSASPDFEFKFTHPGPSLSAEAQKLRASIQEEAAKLKAEMTEQRQKEKTAEAESSAAVAGRKIAKPKGRYSDAHHAAFQKMDSIAGHPSAFRARAGHQQQNQPAAETTVPAQTLRAPNTSLKRTKSQAKLDDPEPVPKKSGKSSPSVKEDTIVASVETGTAKRKKTKAGDDTSAARPRSHSREVTPRIDTEVSTPKHPRANHHISTSFATPTKASLARSTGSASVKHPKTSLIPKLGRPLGSPRIARTEAPNRFRSAFSMVSAMKSILRRPQPRFSDDPLKQAAGTHIATPEGTKDTDHKDTEAPETPQIHNSPSVRHVKFTPGLVAKGKTPEPATPPTRAASTASSKKKKNKDHSQNTEKSPLVTTPTVTYPALPSLDTVSQSPSPVKIQPRHPAVKDFTFRTEKTIKFPTPKASSTIRHVRPSIVPSPVVTSTPTTATATATASEAATAVAAARTDDPLTRLQNLPVVPHGMPNKKRRRSMMETDEDDSDVENQADKMAGKKHSSSVSVSVSVPASPSKEAPPVTPRAAKRTRFVQPDEEIKSAAKRAKLGLDPRTATPKSAVKTAGHAHGHGHGSKHGFGTPKSAAQRVMSLSRLNELAKPKNRK